MSQDGMDEYRSWDAAYVLGTLASSERHEFEEHLSVCEGCRAAVAELAGMPSLLATLSPEEALALGQGERAGQAPGMLPELAKKVRRGRRRVRLAVAAVVVGAAAASGAVTLAVTAPVPPPAQTQAVSGTVLHFTPAVDGSLAAKGSLTAQPWGTRIDWECTYTPASADLPVRPGSGSRRAPEEYALVVVDSRGVTTQVATWTATPGTVATPTATTIVRLADIRRVEIRAIASGRTLLTASA